MGRAALWPGVFLDRDGTLVEERHFLANPEDAVLIETVPKALADLRAAGFKLVVVTNQSGIARGLYTESDYHAVAKRIDKLLDEAGANVDGTFYCPHHPDFTGPCECRKPLTGMYRQAAEVLGIDLAGSYFVGDKVSDVLPALELGGAGVLVRTGYGSEEESRIPDGVTVVDHVGDVARFITQVAVDGPKSAASPVADGVDPAPGSP